jgi:site-specific recombinase XerD
MERLAAEQARGLLNAPDVETIRGKRSRAILTLCPTCGLRRSELAHLMLEHLQPKDMRYCG